MQRRSRTRSSATATVQQRLAELRQRVAARHRRLALDLGDEPKVVDDSEIEYFDEGGDAMDSPMGDLDMEDLGDLPLEGLEGLADEGLDEEACPEGEHQECICVADDKGDKEEDEGEDKDEKDDDKEEDEGEDKEEDEGEDKEEDEGEDKDEKGDKKDKKEKDAAVGTFARFRQIRDQRNAAKAKTAEPEAKTAEPKATWAPLVTEAMLSAEQNPVVEMQLRGASTDDPYYVMWIGDKPVGELHEADLDLDESGRDVFRSAHYVRGVQEAIAQLGAVNTLRDFGLRYYAANTQETDAVKRAKAEIVHNADLAFRQRCAAMNNDLFNTMQLAFTASMKNFILHNDLKDAVVENFRSAGMQEAVAIDLIEDAFQRGGPQYFKAVLDKATEWLGYEPEALKQIEAEVTKMDYRHPRDHFGGQVANDEIQQVRVPQAQTKAPRAAQVASEAVENDLDAQLDAARRLGRRLLNR
jgi:hypothetical protein